MSKLNLIAGHSLKEKGANGVINEGEATIYLRDCILNKLNDRSRVFIDSDADSLSVVIKKINQRSDKNDYTLSIHFNAFNGTATGSEIYIYKNASIFTKRLATNLVEKVSKVLGIYNRGVKTSGQSNHSTLGIIDKTVTNSMLLEVCFCDNKEDVEKYHKNFKELVTTISDFINNEIL